MNNGVGVVLAGGRSKRLDNKILLPLRDKRPMICSSLDLLINVYKLTRIIILDKKESILPKLLCCLYNDFKFEFITDDFSGLSACLCNVGRLSYSELIVVCADNVYPQTYIKPVKDRAVIRGISSLNVINGLVTFESGRWVEAGQGKHSLQALTTPWFLDSKTAAKFNSSDTIVESFNAQGISPILADLHNWADLGTNFSFLRYWSE